MPDGQDADSQRELLDKLLTERGVWGVSSLVEGLSDHAIAGALAAIKRYDKEGRDAPALLSHRLLHDDLGGYRPPSERTSVEFGTKGEGASGEITPTLLKAIRGTCRTPNGITRHEACGVFEHKAGRLGLTADALIDAAMGADWTATPPHAALDPENPNKAAEYVKWVAET